MKKFIIFIILFTSCKYSFCQETEKLNQLITRADFLQKSKAQKTTVWVLLGAAIASFALVAPGNTSFSTLGTVVVIGGISILSSIPLFIVSSKNKRKAANTSTSLEIEKIKDDPLLFFLYKVYPYTFYKSKFIRCLIK